MKVGDCYIDTHYEPQVVILQVTNLMSTAAETGGNCVFIYASSGPISSDHPVYRSTEDSELVAVTVMYIDNQLIYIET